MLENDNKAFFIRMWESLGKHIDDLSDMVMTSDVSQLNSDEAMNMGLARLKLLDAKELINLVIASKIENEEQ